MKQLLVSFFILAGLVLFFFIMDRNSFNCSEEDQIIQTESNEPFSNVRIILHTTKPVTETMPVTESRPKTDVKPAETIIVTETKLSIPNLPITKPMARSKPEDKTKPAAVPVVTAEEAETLNAEALVEFEIQEKRIAKERARLERGFGLAFSEQFEKYKTVPMTKANEDALKKKGYDVEEFKKREIPDVWTVDYSTIPADVSFKKTADGYSIVSPQGNIRFMGQRLNGMRSSFLFELTVKNISDNESKIIFGVHDSGLIKNGYKTLATEKLNSKEKKTIEVELSVFEQLANIAPAISVKGEVVLNDLTIYRKDHDDFTIVEGEIVERSALPDPKDTDYPDCRYTAHFVGNAIISGLSCNKELSLSIDGFHNKKVLNTNSLKVGDKIKCAIVPIDSVPDNLASIQEADELSLFTLDSYLVTAVQKISSYTDTTYLPISSTHFKSDLFDYYSVFDEAINPPIADDLVMIQKERIQKDLETANTMLQSYESARETIESKFQDAWSKEKERFPDGYNTIKIKNGTNDILYWRNINHSFWSLPPQYTFIPETLPVLPNEKLDALIAFRDFLESNGIQLIVSLVPDRYEIASRVINQDFSDVPVYQLASYVKQLSEAGIECPYYPTSIIRQFDLFPFAYFYSRTIIIPERLSSTVLRKH